MEKVIEPQSRREIDAVEASIPYLAKSDANPYRYIGPPPPGIPQEVGDLAHCRARIRAGWKYVPDMSMDSNGFVVVRQPTSFDDFWSPDSIREIYLPEMRDLAVVATGASRAVVFDFNVRHAPSVKDANPFLGKPARLVHNDYTPVSGEQRVIDLLGPEDGAKALKSRYALINLWRPIKGPLRDAPLAVCDARTVSDEDLIVSRLIYPDRVGEVYRVTFNARHQWFYFPDMSRDEILLFKSYDSASHDVARFVPHTAFDDPTIPSDSPPRQSIEVRALCIWE